MPEMKVYTFAPAWGLPTTGPFALKLLAWMRLNGISYEQVIENNTRKGPAGKSPWIELDGNLIADSDVIIENLARRHGLGTTSEPTARSGAAHAFKTAFEDRFHQILEWELMVHPDGVKGFDAMVADLAPPFLGRVVSPLVRRQFAKQLHARGIARHQPDRIAEMGRADIDALAVYLEAYGFLNGGGANGEDKENAGPGLQDLAVFGQVGQMLAWPMPTPVATYVKENRVIGRWATEIKERCGL